jgi:hypothetical protein
MAAREGSEIFNKITSEFGLTRSYIGSGEKIIYRDLPDDRSYFGIGWTGIYDKIFSSSQDL